MDSIAMSDISQPAKKKRKQSNGSATIVPVNANAGDDVGAAANAKKYACDWADCGKSFTRQDHLARHKLNHNPTQIFSCDRCSKKFVRGDLLVRHVERHERRESGGDAKPSTSSGGGGGGSGGRARKTSNAGHGARSESVDSSRSTPLVRDRLPLPSSSSAGTSGVNAVWPDASMNGPARSPSLPKLPLGSPQGSYSPVTSLAGLPGNMSGPAAAVAAAAAAAHSSSSATSHGLSAVLDPSLHATSHTGHQQQPGKRVALSPHHFSLSASESAGFTDALLPHHALASAPNAQHHSVFAPHQLNSSGAAGANGSAAHDGGGTSSSAPFYPTSLVISSFDDSSSAASSGAAGAGGANGTGSPFSSTGKSATGSTLDPSLAESPPRHSAAMVETPASGEHAAPPLPLSHHHQPNPHGSAPSPADYLALLSASAGNTPAGQQPPTPSSAHQHLHQQRHQPPPAGYTPGYGPGTPYSAATPASSWAPGQGAHHSSFEPNPSLSFLQNTFTQPVAFAQDYQWLFDGMADIDFPLAASRPASPGAVYPSFNDDDSNTSPDGVKREGSSSPHVDSFLQLGGNALRSSLAGIEEERQSELSGSTPASSTQHQAWQQQQQQQQQQLGLGANASGTGTTTETTPGAGSGEMWDSLAKAAKMLDAVKDDPVKSAPSAAQQQNRRDSLEGGNAVAGPSTSGAGGPASPPPHLHQLDGNTPHLGRVHFAASPAGSASTTFKLAPPSALQNQSAVKRDADSPSVYGTNNGMTTTDWSCEIDAATRVRIIEFLISEHPQIENDGRLTTRRLTEYVRLFWVRVHETHAPCIHRASFNTRRTPAPLLISMMLLGCFYGDRDAFELAVRLHPTFRGKVFCMPAFRPRAELWLLQTALLTIVFGKLCSNRMAHEMAHIFWGSVVTLFRRSALFSQRLLDTSSGGNNGSDGADAEALWRAWIENESSKRTALIVFMEDVDYAALFRHSPTLSAFQVQLTLPCEEDEWDAPNAQAWLAINRQPGRTAPMPFISALKSCLIPGPHTPPLNPFSRILALHGLMSLSQDLQWRDHVIGFSSPEGRARKDWREMISGAYNAWKARVDTTLLTAPRLTCLLLRASISLYAVAHITLSIDIHELQIWAGAESALGLMVPPAVYESTVQRIRRWSASKEGRAATWHAAHFLRSSLQHYYQNVDDLSASLPHKQTVVIAVLALYAYGTATSGAPKPLSSDGSDMIATGAVQDECMAYLDGMCTQSPEGLVMVPNKNDVLPVVATIWYYVKGSRWEVAQEGARILERLILPAGAGGAGASSSSTGGGGGGARATNSLTPA